ncbi:hypothetical protein F3Y22_tig00000132pilonHSYRG00076 [Hibiscus syriacus]|uniref:Uncharacterized protein n=1 Tax=Hibiscus syriacus TaxID=106335 RepID=A0A6A3D6K8_HIBSY|nr:hypothetical protein F3Y22_tig00000132pilonHSYRG00076 [Hibiscus syriacus]
MSVISSVAASCCFACSFTFFLQVGAVDDSNYIILSSSQNLSSRFSQPQNLDDEGKSEEKQSLENPNGFKILPFAKTLELEAHPALDKLTSKISTLNLERVHQIKSRLVAITGSIQKVRDELEHLLDDDEDMAEMYLTGKELLENSSTSSMNDREDMGGEVLRPYINDRC